MKIFIGADHRGFQVKNKLADYLRQAGYTVIDDGPAELDPADDFPLFAQKVVSDVLSSKDDDPRGLLICGSGQGMCMAANRFKGIRAMLGYNRESARAGRNDDDSNVLCLPADSLNKEEADQIIETWLNTPFAGAPRYVRRLKKMDEV